MTSLDKIFYAGSDEVIRVILGEEHYKKMLKYANDEEDNYSEIGDLIRDYMLFNEIHVEEGYY